MLTSKPRTKAAVVTVAEVTHDATRWLTTPLRKGKKRFRKNLFDAKIDKLDMLADECEECRKISSTPAGERTLSDFCSAHRYIGYSKYVGRMISPDVDPELMIAKNANWVTFDGRIAPPRYDNQIISL
jgi:hypothetical protein